MKNFLEIDNKLINLNNVICVIPEETVLYKDWSEFKSKPFILFNSLWDNSTYIKKIDIKDLWLLELKIWNTFFVKLDNWAHINTNFINYIEFWEYTPRLYSKNKETLFGFINLSISNNKVNFTSMVDRELTNEYQELLYLTKNDVEKIKRL